MKRYAHQGLAVVLALVIQHAAQGVPPVKVRALKDNTNLRARPALNVEVVGQVSAGEELVARSIETEWVEVVAPTNIDFWVLGDYLKDGRVTCRQTVNVRAGPGINFSIVGQLANGAEVALRGNLSPSLLTTGRPEEVDAAVKHLVDNIWNKGGKLILDAAFGLPDETPVENVRAMFDAARKYAG